MLRSIRLPDHTPTKEYRDEGPDKEKLRENRLKLLDEIRDATRTVADFSRIEG
jgi:hypothetical protein